MIDEMIYGLDGVPTVVAMRAMWSLTDARFARALGSPYGFDAVS
jgi:hypothetical protein